jgi:putative transposase
VRSLLTDIEAKLACGFSISLRADSAHPFLRCPRSSLKGSRNVGPDSGFLPRPGLAQNPTVRWAVATLAIAILRSVFALFRGRQDQAIVELALRQQLAVFAHRHPRPRLSPLDRAFWVALSRFWPRWRSALLVVQPETVIRWHREGFRRYWRSISVPGPGRPPIAEDIQTLIVRMATENHWRARKIQAELSKLGIEVSLATISRYLPKPKPDPGSQQRWITFLRNRRDVIAGMDFFVVPTVRFQLLYVWFAIDHGRRRILHFNVTANPAARWVLQQLRKAFPDDPSHRFMIFDNDAIFSAEVARTIARFGVHPQRTAFQSPWQNGTAERFVGTVRRELLDHVVVLSEDHLRRLLREYVAYYNAERVHTSIADSPAGRMSEIKPSGGAKLVRLPRVGGLHCRYTWREAA